MKNVDHRPVLNLKKLIQYIPYVPFKMDDRFGRNFYGKRTYICKIDLNNAYIPVPLSIKTQRFPKFKWKGSL